jgi:hypothetical protein
MTFFTLWVDEIKLLRTSRKSGIYSDSRKAPQNESSAISFNASTHVNHKSLSLYFCFSNSTTCPSTGEYISRGRGSPGSILPPTIPEHRPFLYTDPSRTDKPTMKGNADPRSTPSHNTFHFPDQELPLHHPAVNQHSLKWGNTCRSKYMQLLYWSIAVQTRVTASPYRYIR